MACLRLSDGTTNIDFDPGKGYEIPESRRRSVHETLDKTLYVYEWGNKKQYEVLVLAFNKIDADQVNSWWQDLTELSFYYDFRGQPSSYTTVIIINTNKPLQMMRGWQDKYSGDLILKEK